MKVVSLNVRDAAAAVGVSPDRIKMAIRAGHLAAKTTSVSNGRVSGRYLIRPADLEAWYESLEDA